MRLLTSLAAVVIAIAALIVSLGLTLAVRHARLDASRLPAQLPAETTFRGDLIVAHPGERTLTITSPSDGLILQPGTPWQVIWERPQPGRHTHTFLLREAGHDAPVDRIDWTVTVAEAPSPTFPQPSEPAVQQPEPEPVAALPEPEPEPEPVAALPEPESRPEPRPEPAEPAVDTDATAALPAITVRPGSASAQVPGKAAVYAPDLEALAPLSSAFISGHTRQVAYQLEPAAAPAEALAQRAALAAIGADSEQLPEPLQALLIQAAARHGVINRGRVTWRLARAAEMPGSFAIHITRNDLHRR